MVTKQSKPSTYKRVSKINHAASISKRLSTCLAILQASEIEKDKSYEALEDALKRARYCADNLKVMK